jgi:hypothetical protein
MKRLAWLLLLVFGTALAQVSPVDLAAPRGKSCTCCEVPGACGLPDCNLPPSSAPAGIIAEQPARVAQLGARRNTARPRRVALDSVVFPGAARAALAALNSPARTTAALQVPLFKAHCSFLI